MIVHVLNGDSLAGTLRLSGLEGYPIICREFLIDGPVNASGLYSFWKARADYALKVYGEPLASYHVKVRQEFDKLERLPKDAEINLWFENDLFCQVNYWFVISQLNRIGLTRVYRVFPLQRRQRKPWVGFGDHQPVDLRVCLDERENLTRDDFKLGEHLWNAYRQGNFDVLRLLSDSRSLCYPCLKEVCNAEIERKTQQRPQVALQKIVESGGCRFEDIFREFSETEGIYGFGDWQVDIMLRNMGMDSVHGLRSSLR